MVALASQSGQAMCITEEDYAMDAFFILPIFILLGLLAWCVLQLKNDM